MKSISRHIMAAITAAAAIISVAQPAAADVSPNWPTSCQSKAILQNGKWQFVLNFDTATAVSCIASKTSNGTLTFSQQQCDVVGAVDVAGGTATFNGGYIRCALNPPGAGVGSFGQFTVFARADVQSFGSAVNDNPVVVHPNVSLYLPRENLSPYIDMSSSFNGVLRNTKSVATTAVMHSYLAEYLCPSSCQRYHLVDGSARQSFVEANKVAFDKNANAIYIGFDPATGKLFKGKIDLIVVDPQGRDNCC